MISMKQIKVRNIDNSVGIILTKELGLVNGDIIQAEKKATYLFLIFPKLPENMTEN